MANNVGKRPTLVRFGTKRTFAGRSVKKGITKRALHSNERGRPERKMIPLRKGR